MESHSEKGPRDGLLRLRPEPALMGRVGEAPVLGFGPVSVLGTCPDFESDVLLQKSNDHPRVKLTPKKSWEIGENYVGGMLGGSPYSFEHYKPWFQPVHLIDGNRQTEWCSRGQARPDVEPVRLRLDLPVETAVRQITLVLPTPWGMWPGSLTVKVSTDAWHWTPVFADEALTRQPEESVLEIRLPHPRQVKQVEIVAGQLPNYRYTDAEAIVHSFALAEIEILDLKGENVALASRGATVLASSTQWIEIPWEHPAKDPPPTADADPGLMELLWPTFFDVGFKWLRLGTCGALAWGTVERERGIYRVDPVADAMIAMAEANGVKVILNLANHGNPLYGAGVPGALPRRGAATFQVAARRQAEVSVQPETTEGYVNWVRFMAGHFRGRISYFEVGNEPAVSVKQYCDQAKRAATAVREMAPEAKILLASSGAIPGRDVHLMPRSPWPWYIRISDELFRAIEEEDILPYVDALGWHPQECLVTDLAFTFDTYPRLVAEFQALAKDKGFRGDFLVTEYHDLGGDPAASWRLGQGQYGNGQDPRNDREMLTEIQQAKNFARVAVLHAALEVPIMWCEALPTPTQAWLGQSLFRSPWQATPICPVAPTPLYYVVRNLGTMLDGLKPADLAVRFSIDRPWLDSRSFRHANGTVIAVWRKDFCHDYDPGVEVDVTVEKRGEVRRVSGVDSLNGFRQGLNWREEDDSIVLPGLLIRDYPLLLELDGPDPASPSDR
jgi:hypothetical protein